MAVPGALLARGRLSRAGTSERSRRRTTAGQESADAGDGVEVVAAPHGPDRPAVGERLVDREVEAVLRVLELVPVEGALGTFERETAARRAALGGMVRAFAEEEQLDPSIGGGLQRVRPAGRAAPVSSVLRDPALDELLLALGAPALEHGHGHLEKLGGLRVSLGVRDPRDRGARVLRHEVDKLGAGLLGGDHDDARAVQPAHDPVEHVGDPAQVLVGELVGVALKARLRPAALVVAPRLLLRVVGEVLEPSAAEPVEAPLLAAHDEDEGTLAPADQRHEWGEVEALAHTNVVRNDLSERERPPDVVEPGAEDGQPVGALPLELRLEVAPDALEVVAQGEPLLVRQLALVGPVILGRLVQQRVQARVCVPGRMKETGIEVEIEADRNPLLGLETGEIAQLVPGDGSCHRSPLVGFPCGSDATQSEQRALLER